MPTIPPEKLKELMLKVRKGATASLTLAQVEAILQAIGAKVEFFVGFVPGLRKGDRNALFLDSLPEAESALAKLQKLQVSSLPAKPKLGMMYVKKIDPIEPWVGGHQIFFDSVTAAPGVKIEMPDGKKTEILPSVYQIPEARDFLQDGPKKLSVYVPDVIRWLTKETDWVARVNSFLGVEEHLPAEVRTRDRTGSCPVCFSNVKLSPRNEIVLHGYQRPGHGSVQGRCFGVSFLPFELSPKGSSQFLSQILEPSYKSLQAESNSLQAEDLDKFVYGNRVVERGDPSWDLLLSRAREDAKSKLRQSEMEKEAYEKLVQKWKERALPKEGDRHIDWFVEGRKASLRVVQAFLLKRALETKKWGPFVFKIDRPKGFKKEWPQADGSVKKYTYPVDYGYFVGHTGEDEEGLDAFVGDDPEGKIECFLKMKPSEENEAELVPDETKFLIGLSKDEREKVMGLYRPREVTELQEFKDFYELVDKLSEFRDKKAAKKLASRFLSASARGVVARYLSAKGKYDHIDFKPPASVAEAGAVER